MAEPLGLVGERGVERLAVDLAAFEPGPRVGVGVGRVDAPDEVRRQPVRRLVPVERLERAGEDHAAEVEEHCVDHGGRLYDDAVG